MPFNDTTNRTGLIQECEFWTNLGDTTISGDSVLLQMFTTRINRSFDRVMPRVLSHDTNQRWDDVNHPTHPIGTADIISGQNDYTFLADSAGNSVLNITKILAKQSATATDYGVELFQVIPGDIKDIPGVQSGRIGTIDSSQETRVLSPFAADLGMPNRYVEKGNTFFVWPIPNFSCTAGFKIFFERTPSYFVSTDTTKQPGIPAIFHQLLALYASKDWLILHKPGNQVVIADLGNQIKEQEDNLDTMIGKRNPNMAGIRVTQDRAD
jgi:hypothetical protein